MRKTDFEKGLVMDLKTARKVAAEMEKNLGGQYKEALNTLGRYLHFISQDTKNAGYEPRGFMAPEMYKDLWKAWPERDF